MSHPHNQRRRRAAFCIALLWVVAVGLGSVRFMAYAGKPGRQPPSQKVVSARGDRYSLVMFVHPDCPCSRASLAELGHLARMESDLLSISVQFVEVAGAARGSERGDLWAQARAIPGAVVSVDRGGWRAKEYGARVSGFTLLYGPDGHLLFQGGITQARGHEGDSVGRASILAHLRERPAPARAAQVFGCSLFKREGKLHARLK